MRSAQTYLVSLAACTILLLTPSFAPAANLLSNGGFEEPIVLGSVAVPAGSPAITGWSIDQGTVNLINPGGFGPLTGNAYEGYQLIELAGTSSFAKIRQIATPTIGQAYIFQFAYANDYLTSATATATVRLFGGIANILEPLSFTHSSSFSGSLNWTLYSFSFTAATNYALVEFTSGGPVGVGGMLIDDVRVSAVPELAGNLALTVGLFGLWLRRAGVGVRKPERRAEA